MLLDIVNVSSTYSALIVTLGNALCRPFIGIKRNFVYIRKSSYVRMILYIDIFFRDDRPVVTGVRAVKSLGQNSFVREKRNTWT